MIFDSHIHTKFSTDSLMNIKDALSMSKKHSIGLIITEHMDLNYPENAGFRFNPDEYFKAYEPLKNDSLLLGIELGLSNDIIHENKAIIYNYSFDQVIGSIHTLNNEDIGFLTDYDSKPYSEILKNYFTFMESCILDHPFIDTLAHIDYICRYAPVKDSEIYYLKYKNYIDAVLQACIKTDTALEINTRRLNDKCAHKNLLSIYKRYKELGGHYVTIGSDAHDPQGIFKNFSAALEIAENCNLTPIYFKNRKPIKF